MSTKNARRSNYIFEYRITVLGSSRVGKTSLIKRFTDDEFSDKHIATTEDHFQHVVEHNGSTCVCLLVDTSGSFEFPAMRKRSISKANAFIVVYSVIDKKSFAIAKMLVNEIKEVKGSNDDIKIMLVGNKTDFEHGRKITKEEARDYARDISDADTTCDFVETSAKDDINVSESVHGLLNMFLPEVPLEGLLAERPPLDKKASTFPRSLGLKKKSKARKGSVVRKELLRRSDENLLDIDKPVCRQRAYSLDTNKNFCDSDSDSGPPSPSNDLDASLDSPDLRQYRRQSSAKELLRRTTSACKVKIDQAKKKLRGSNKLHKASRQTSVDLYNA